jgi:hypothetical protein
MMNATPKTTATEMTLATSEVSTCDQSTPERAIGMDWNRPKIPVVMSVKSRNAVYEMSEATVMSRMPGNREPTYMPLLAPWLIAPPNT